MNPFTRKSFQYHLFLLNFFNTKSFKDDFIPKFVGLFFIFIFIKKQVIYVNKNY